MADSKSDSTRSVSVTDKKEVKAPNFLERAKEEFEAIMHHQKSPRHRKETHGMQCNGIDENTSVDDVEAPNVFERAKEEFDAIAQALHSKKESPTHDRRDETKMAGSKDKDETKMAESKEKQKIAGSQSENNAKKPNIFVRAKEEIRSIIHHDKSPHRHHKETHGLSDDIDENTATNEVKAPNVFERVKEEFEAVVEAMHPKKER